MHPDDNPLIAPILKEGVLARDLADLLTPDEDHDGEDAHERREAAVDAEQAVVADGVQHVVERVREAEAEEAAERADDDEQGGSALGVRVDEVDDGDGVGADCAR